MPESVILGNDIETGQSLRLGDIERRSGLYILGKPGMGKSALLINAMIDDIDNGHGVFFLDPHADAITDLLNRSDYGVLSSFGKVLGQRQGFWSKTHGCVVPALSGCGNDSCTIHIQHIPPTAWAQGCLLNPSRPPSCNPLQIQ